MHASNSGTYTKIGNTVHLRGIVYSAAIGSVSGSVLVSGMPFSSNSERSAVSIGFASVAGITAGTSLSGSTIAGSTSFNLRNNDLTTGHSSLQHDEWGSNAYAIISCTYMVA